MRRAVFLAVLLMPSLAHAATKMFLHEAAASISGYKVMDFGMGPAVTTAVTNTAAGPTSGIQVTKTAGGSVIRWVSCPVEAVTISGTVTINAWGQESNAAANTGWDARVHRYTSGEVAAFLTTQNPGAACQANGTSCTELTTSNAATQWTATPASTSFNAGDRIVVKFFINDASGSMGSGRTATFRYDGTTASASGDTWVQFNETITCQPPVQPHFQLGFDDGTLTRAEWTATGTSVPGVVYDDSRWWVQFDPAASTEYVEMPVTSGIQNHTDHFTLRVNTFPAAETVIRRACAGASCASPQALVTLDSDQKMRVRFKDLTNECTANSLYKYTDCTTDADCPVDIGGNPGEAACAQAVFAQSGILSADTDYHVAIVSTSDTSGARPQEMHVALYLDGYNRGSKARWQGVCSSGCSVSISGKACGATSDCTTLCTNVSGTGSPTCGSGATIGNATSVRVGTDVSGTADYQIRDWVFTPSNIDAYARYLKIQPLWPAADSAVAWGDVNTNCTGNAPCVRDTLGGGALDDDANTPGAPTTTLNSSTLNETDIWDLDDYTIESGETVVSAYPRAAVREQDNNANTTKPVVIGLRDGGLNESLGSSVNLATYNETPAQIHIQPGAIVMAAPGGASWSQSTVNALRGLTRYTGATGVGNRVRVTNYVAGLQVALPPPPTTDVFPDVNANGRKTLCVTGDSIMNDPALYESLNGLAAEPDDILACAKGGMTIADLDNSWTNILDGVNTGSIPCVAQRGELAACDVVFLHIGANDFSRSVVQATETGMCYQRGCVSGANDGLACTTNAQCPGGTCTDKMGPQQGDACEVPTGHQTDGAGRAVFRRSYCIQGDNIGQCCAGLACSAVCGGPGGCNAASGANWLKPCTKATEVTDCGGADRCEPWAGYGARDLDDVDQTYTVGWCNRGAASTATCPLGVCMHTTTTAYMVDRIRSMLAVADARTGSSAVKVVLLGNSDPRIQSTVSKNCVGGADLGDECTIDANCASPGKCKMTGDTWPAGMDDFRWFAQWLKVTAEQQNRPYGALGAYQRRVATVENEHLRDNIHQSDIGQDQMAALITACASRATDVPENLCGDLTVSKTCPPRHQLQPLGDFSDALGANVLTGSDLCTPTESLLVDAIVIHIDTAPIPAAHVQCSVHTRSGGTITKVNDGCDTSSTEVAQAGWLTLGTSNASACALSNGVTYSIHCNTDDAGLAYTANRNTVPGARHDPTETYASGMQATASVGLLRTITYPWYLQVHAP